MLSHQTCFSKFCQPLPHSKQSKLSTCIRPSTISCKPIIPRPSHITKGSAADMAAFDDPRLDKIAAAIRTVPNFPKPGIMFYDICSLLLLPDVFQLCTDVLTERYKDQHVDVVAGFDARGLIFGAPLALALKVPFVPLRKPGKLPGETESAEYITEYSTDTIELQKGSIKPGQRVLLVDDLVATGGTLEAGIKLVEKVGGEVVEAACIIELPELKGRERLKGLPLFVLLALKELPVDAASELPN